MDYENENGARGYDGSSHCSTSLFTEKNSQTSKDHKLTPSPTRTDDAPRYERDRSASPRPARRNDSPRRRSASPNGNGHVDSR